MPPSTKPAVLTDVRYALRCLRRSPLFSASVTATIGLGLGILCSGFTFVNAYIFKPLDLPNPYELYALSWDTSTVWRHRFNIDEFEALREGSPHFSGLTAVATATVMQDGVAMRGLLVEGNYFQVLRAGTMSGRTIMPDDARAPGQGAVVVLSNEAWRARFGGDPAIVGKTITLGQHRFDVIGVMARGFALPGAEAASFFVPVTMARAFNVDLWSDARPPSLFVIGRMHPTATASQVRAWLDVWLRQRFPPGSENAPINVRVDSRATPLTLDGTAWTMFVVIVSAFALVLLVACANVTNLVLARGFSRQREIAVRLSLGASRGLVIRQLVIESLVLAVPAAALGLGLTIVTARIFPRLILSTFPMRNMYIEGLLAPLDPDVRVLGMLALAAIVSAVVVSLMPALHVTRANLVRASKGEEALDTRRSRLRTGLVVLQIGASVLFLISAASLIGQSRRLANPNTELDYKRVSHLSLAPRLRSAVAARLASDPSVAQVVAAWDPPMAGVLPSVGVVASTTRIEQRVGFMAVSPEYFPAFDVRLVRGRTFTTREADDSAPVAVVSEATARLLWPGVDPIGQTLQLIPATGVRRRPSHPSVRIIGVAEDVASSSLIDGVDATCVYFATGFEDAGQLSILIRDRGDAAATRAAVAAAVNAIEPNAAYEFMTLPEIAGFQAWVFQAFSVTASVLGVTGLALAFSGTYAVVAFLVTRRRREFGIRMALGASVGRIVTGMLGETLRTASIGLVAGAGAAFALSRIAGGGPLPLISAFAISPYFISIAIVLLATATAALLPSLRATRIDPSQALRVE